MKHVVPLVIMTRPCPARVLTEIDLLSKIRDSATKYGCSLTAEFYCPCLARPRCSSERGDVWRQLKDARERKEKRNVECVPLEDRHRSRSPRRYLQLRDGHRRRHQRHPVVPRALTMGVPLFIYALMSWSRRPFLIPVSPSIRATSIDPGVLEDNFRLDEGILAGPSGTLGRRCGRGCRGSG